MLEAKKLDCIIAACESLFIDQSDFNNKKTESSIILFNYVNLVEKMKIDLGRGNLVSFISQINMDSQNVF